ncbi:hypothetical protein PoB_001589700 [Plakobranchus ocellatus]|uniref:Uncharacterized protein n=1 Tax=Plakobranchus ocellatus TaxID=259542 RepID=A0AAV3Z4F5_9GAST|nr:hypothetical protein PoB_001589700 [Plakobranchus ocellatus]
MGQNLSKHLIAAAGLVKRMARFEPREEQQDQGRLRRSGRVQRVGQINLKMGGCLINIRIILYDRCSRVSHGPNHDLATRDLEFVVREPALALGYPDKGSPLLIGMHTIYLG